MTAKQPARRVAKTPPATKAPMPSDRAARRERRAATPAEPCAGARRPLQERGQRRVEAILDATAAMIAEAGLPAVTMHGVARRSGTTVGSMYHFFPDLSCVFRALAERHVIGLRALLEAVRATAAEWSALSTAEAVDRFLDPLLDFIESHPDLLPVMRHVRAPGAQPRDARVDALMQELAGIVVAGRQPRAAPAERATRAATMLAVVDGVVQRASQVPTPPHRTMMRELKRVLVAYLEAGAADAPRATPSR